MRKVLGFLIDFQKKHFEWRLYVFVAAFLCISLLFNYTLDFERSILGAARKTPLHWLYMFLWQGIPFLSVCFMVYFFTPHKSWLKDRRFWVVFIVGFSITGLDRSFYLHEILLDDIFKGNTRLFVNTCIRWSSSILTVVLPLMIFSYVWEPKDSRVYFGVSNTKFDPRPYFMLLGLAVLLIGIGSFFSDIQAYYPRYAKSYGAPFAREFGWPGWLPVIIYELCYGSDFLGVELFFRGFLIITFSRFLGGYVVLPMIATYCFLHFGKPMTEAISSVFGGYILGIVTLYTRSIWGGVIIHVGIAWAMELFGYLHRLI